ncbi:CoA-transferase family III domain-containing protein [Mycena amicta]|nr:CoA-transferase family III domain-containing protein [Mycena amicta]
MMCAVLCDSVIPMAPPETARAIWLSANLPPTWLSRLTLCSTSTANNAINSSFQLGCVAQTSIGLAGLSAALFHSLRSGVEQDVRVDVRHAVLEFHSEAFYTLDRAVPAGVWDSIAGLYKTKDNSYVRIHTNVPHHRRGILSLLGLPDEPSTSRADSGMCATAMRSYAAWREHPHAKALEGVPPVQIIKIGDAPKRSIAGGSRPLDGIRVLDLSRVLAGPITAHGADVLLVTSPVLPALPTLDVDTSRGKRTTQLDLTQPADRAKLRTLASEADVFLQAYRPGGLGTEGLRAGSFVANLTAWGWDGPWKDRRGFDSLVQTATGFNVSEAISFSDNYNPKPLPMQALDHAAGYLLAFGINAALCKTITEGGSYEVRVSLAAVGQWIRALGQLPPSDAFGPSARPFPAKRIPVDEEIEKLSGVWRSPDGREMTALRHAAVLERTPVRDSGEGSLVPMRLDANEAEWLPRA